MRGKNQQQKRWKKIENSEFYLGYKLISWVKEIEGEDERNRQKEKALEATG